MSHFGLTINEYCGFVKEIGNFLRSGSYICFVYTREARRSYRKLKWNSMKKNRDLPDRKIPAHR